MDETSDDQRPHALVVDDEALIRMDAVAILEDAGFGIYDAGTADEALTILEAHHRSIKTLFTDVEMPGGMDGFGLARETAERWPDISIIVASGRHQPKPGDMPDGAEFVGKPFSAEVVMERLKHMMPERHKPEPLKS